MSGASTVLIVEDDEDLRELMSEVLKDHGYHVVVANEGQEALDALAGIDKLCLVLLDLAMPGMNGWDFLETFRALPEKQHVPVVVQTSAPAKAPAGATRVLRKPVSSRDLLAVVREHCAP